MTAIDTTPSTIRARPTGFVHDVTTIAGRALRAVPRDLEAVIPPVFIAIFFFVVNIATLERLTEGAIGGFDYTAFQMPTAILLGVTGVSRAPALVLDVVSLRCDGDRAVAAGVAGDAGINPIAIAAWLEPAGVSNVVPLRAGIDLDTDTLLPQILELVFESIGADRGADEGGPPAAHARAVWETG